MHRSFAGLLKPLDYHQGAPLGFLLLEKLATRIAGNGELALRGVPLLAGLISLVLFWRVARAYLSESTVPLAVALFALSPGIIHYASEAKQYSLDVVVTLVLLWAAAKLADPTPSPARLLKFSLLGAIAVWFSHPAVFVLAGIAVTLIAATLLERNWKRLRGFALMTLAWAGSFALNYFVFLRPLGADAALLEYWRQGFPPHSIASLQNAAWIVDSLFRMFEDPAGLWAFLGVALFGAGCISLIRRSRIAFFLLIAPLGFALLAALLHRYPFSGRLLLFLVPILLIVIAEGTAWLAGRWPRSSTAGLSHAWYALLIVALLARPVIADGREAVHPARPDDLKPVIRYVLSHREPGDVWFVYHYARYQYWYYTELYRISPAELRIGRDCDTDVSCYAADLDQLRGHGRVWVVFSHIWTGSGLNEEDFAVQHLDHMGKRLDRFSATGARAYLYDLSETPDKPLQPGENE